VALAVELVFELAVEDVAPEPPQALSPKAARRISASAAADAARVSM
jgi:hypothetical protein